MSLRELVFAGTALGLFVASSIVAATAQTASEPTAYTVKTTNSIFGQPQIMTVYRLGSKALVDLIGADNAADPKASHTRSLYDLDKHRNFSWSWPDSSATIWVKSGKYATVPH